MYSMTLKGQGQYLTSGQGHGLTHISCISVEAYWRDKTHWDHFHVSSSSQSQVICKNLLVTSVTSDDLSGVTGQHLTLGHHEWFMILKELHLTDALGRISIFPPLAHNGEVRILTWPQVIDISKIRDMQIVGTSGLIKFWKLEKILLRTVAVARAYTFLEVRSRDSNWWPDLMWPRHQNFTTDVKLINEKVCQGYAAPFSFRVILEKPQGFST